MKLTDIKIDPEFRSLIEDQLTPDQIDTLAADIKEHGFREKLVVWKEEGILLDGHHRYDLMGTGKVNGQVPQVIEYSFPSHTMAKRWVILNQLGRRNLNSTRAAYCRGKLYNELKLDHGGDRSDDGSSAHIERLKKTAENKANPPEAKGRDATAADVARATKTSPATVKRDAKFAAAVDALPKPERQKALSGETSKASVIREHFDGKSKPKPRQPKFADNQYEKPLGQLVRYLTDRFKACGGPSWRDECKEHLSTFEKTLKEWRKEFPS